MLANYLLIIPVTSFLLAIAYVVWHRSTGKGSPGRKGLLVWAAISVALGIFFTAMGAFLEMAEPLKAVLILTAPAFFWVAFVFYRNASSAE